MGDKSSIILQEKQGTLSRAVSERFGLARKFSESLYGHSIEVTGSRIYVTRGYSKERSQFNFRTLVYDIRLNEWDVLMTSGSSPPARTSGTLTLVGDRLYLIGGQLILLNGATIVEFLDLALNEWRVFDLQGIPMPQTFGHVTEYFEERNELLLIGCGRDDTPEELRSVLALNVATHTLYAPRVKGIRPRLKAYPASCRIAQAVFLFGGKGIGESYEGSIDMHILHVYAASLCWSFPIVKGHKPSIRLALQISRFHGKLVIFGGRSDEDFKSDMFMYDPKAAEWQFVDHEEYSDSLAGYKAIAVNNKVYMIGGMHGGIDELNPEGRTHPLSNVLVLYKGQRSR